MGGYLSSPQPALPPLAQGKGPPDPWPGPAAAQNGVHRRRRVHTRPFPDREPAKAGTLATGTWKRLPAKPSGTCIWESPMRRPLWSARHPGQACSPVTVRITRPERGRAAPVQGARCAGRPDPCARETVLKALSQCRKGSRRFDGPLWFETPESASRTPGSGPRPSAFKPLIKNGVVPSFVPKPGPLDQSHRSWGHNVCKKGTAPGPDVRPSLPVADPTVGTAPAQGAEPQPQSGETVWQCRGLAPSPGAQSGVSRGSFAPQDA
ncbi:POM121-like protein 12 [Pteropus medius]|uniref:POM121-like protein 12 n=1 Tax=Pteropus vampyrus TaxID=132908 RepID=UPI00196BA905|nr:POM121-like protein 12 [Pteropus giganteus]